MTKNNQNNDLMEEVGVATKEVIGLILAAATGLVALYIFLIVGAAMGLQ
jgi:hypothetical protein